MTPLETENLAVETAKALISKFHRLADRRGFIEIRPVEVAPLAIDLGYRSSHWTHGNSTHWLAAHLATAGHHPAMANFCYRNGFLDPAQSGPEYVSASLNRLLKKD